MTLRPIVTLGDPRLRMPGKRIDSFGAWLHELLDDMTETMRDAPGVGIAAQQVGEALQLCVIEVDGALYEIANPEIVHLSGEQEDYEGCLSVPGFVAIAATCQPGRDGRPGPARQAHQGRPAPACWHAPSSTSTTISRVSCTSISCRPERRMIPVSELHDDDDDDDEELATSA